MRVAKENTALVNTLPLAFLGRKEAAGTCPVPMVVLDPSAVADDDDSSIVSSLSSDDEPCQPVPHLLPKQQEPPPRSIFKTYWKETSGTPTRRIPCKAIPCPPSPKGVDLLDPFRSLSEHPETATFPNVEYQHFLSHSSFTSNKGGGGVDWLVSPYASRPLAVTGRNWGGWWRASLPSLEVFQKAAGEKSTTHGSGSARRNKSESNLNARPPTLASCLRTSRRYSGGCGDCAPQLVPSQDSSLSSPTATPRRSSTTSIVSFQQVVDVVRFEAPMESWAAEGWSSAFDYRGA
jgi:hypothetical protein